MKRRTATRLKQPVWIYAIWAAALGALILTVWNIPLQELFGALANLRPVHFFILGGLNLAIILLLAGRWWLILRAQGQPRNLLDLTGYRLAAFSIAYFTPGPQFGGEPLQIHLLRNQQGISSSEAITSVSLDRLIELIANFSFLAVGLFVVLQSGLIGELPSGQALTVTLAFLLVPVIYLITVAKGKRPIQAILNKIKNPRWQATIHTVAETERLIGAFCRQKTFVLLQTLGFSMLAWIVMVAEYTLMLNFLGFSITLPQAIVALTAARLAFIVPLPGGLGAFEASQVLAAEALGLNPLSGLTISLVIRARDVTIAGLGLWLSTIYLKQSPIPIPISQTGEEE